MVYLYSFAPLVGVFNYNYNYNRECMGNSKRVLKRSISLQHERTDHLHALRIASQRGGVFMSEANGHIGVRCEALIAWKPPMVEQMMSPIMLFLENG